MKIELLEALCNASGISQWEKEIRDILCDELGNITDEVLYDGLGSVIYHKKGSGPKVMVAAHMDEVGFMVRTISDFGMLTVMPIGSVRQTAYMNQEIVITTKNHKKIVGILQSEVGNDGKAKDTYIDLGLDTKQEVLDLGISIGDCVTFNSKLKLYGDKRIAAKALDDRAGVYCAIEAMKNLKGNEDVYFAFTSSEEVGTFGSQTCAEIVKPDVAIVVDVACWHSENQRNHLNNRQLSKGTMIVHFDKTHVGNRYLINKVNELADKNHLPVQQDMFSGGGTDAGKISLSNGGVPTLVLGIPLRYGHGPYSICDAKDLDTTTELLIKFIEDISKDNANRGRFYEI